MSRHIAVIAVFAGALLAGCATWTHPTKGETEYYHDESICRARAEGASATGGQMAWSRVYEGCMKGYGWQLSQSESHPQARHQAPAPSGK